MAPFVVGSQKENARNNTTALEQRLGLATSVIIPLLELGAMGYSTWVLCYLIFTQYLINPSKELQQSFNVEPRRGTGIALIVIYAVLLFLMLFPFMRLLQVIWSKPDVLPVGDSTREKKDTSTQAMDQYDAFICDYEGFPLFCDKCHIFKPDRAHHCKELGRCVRKMDHFCPWAGGIIGESTHKFFMLFVFYTACYTTFVWIVTAIFLAERNSKVRTSSTAGKDGAELTNPDGITPRDMDRSFSCWGAFLHIYCDNVIYDRVQPRDKLHLSGGHSERRCFKYCIPHHKLAPTANTTYFF